jgi:predicted RNase H-like HicB family nuclease
VPSQREASSVLGPPARLQVRIGVLPVEMEWEEEAAQWVTYVPALNNISTFGPTQTEALARTRAMMRDYIESMVAENLPLPLTEGERRDLMATLRQS